MTARKTNRDEDRIPIFVFRFHCVLRRVNKSAVFFACHLIHHEARLTLMVVHRRAPNSLKTRLSISSSLSPPSSLRLSLRRLAGGDARTGVSRPDPPRVSAARRAVSSRHCNAAARGRISRAGAGGDRFERRPERLPLPEHGRVHAAVLAVHGSHDRLRGVGDEPQRAGDVPLEGSPVPVQEPRRQKPLRDDAPLERFFARLDLLAKRAPLVEHALRVDAPTLRVRLGHQAARALVRRRVRDPARQGFAPTSLDAHGGFTAKCRAADARFARSRSTPLPRAPARAQALARPRLGGAAHRRARRQVVREARAPRLERARARKPSLPRGARGALHGAARARASPPEAATRLKRREARAIEPTPTPCDERIVPLALTQNVEPRVEGARCHGVAYARHRRAARLR